MGIEFSQIHNLVRTYQRVLNVPSNGESREEESGRETEDRISISPQARRQGPLSGADLPVDAICQQDKECPK